MGSHARHVIRRLVNLYCAASSISRKREKVVPRARRVIKRIGHVSRVDRAPARPAAPDPALD